MNGNDDAYKSSNNVQQNKQPKKLQFNATMSTITMGGEQNEIGWCLRLEVLADSKNMN